MYVPRQSEKWARAPERAPGRAWKCGAPQRAWAVLSLKIRGSGTSLGGIERENANLRNELDPFWAWKCESPELLSRPWEAMNGLKLKKFWKWWSPERQNPPKILKWWCSGTDFLVICENDMLRNGNSGLKMGVSRAAHTQYAYIWKYSPPPPRGGGEYYPLNDSYSLHVKTWQFQVYLTKTLNNFFFSHPQALRIPCDFHVDPIPAMIYLQIIPQKITIGIWVSIAKEPFMESEKSNQIRKLWLFFFYNSVKTPSDLAK